MTQTFQGIPARVELANLERGDVVMCRTAPSGPAALSDLDRVAIVVPLASRSELEWLLRALLRYPNVGHLVVTGDDQRAGGEALLALWQHGLDEQGKVPGSRGFLAPDIDAVLIDALRAAVTVTDLRDEPAASVVAAIAALPATRLERDEVDLPEPEIAARTVFLSRKTSFPIFSSDVGDSWLQLLNLAQRIGTPKRSGDGEGFAEALNVFVTIETPVLEDGEHQLPDDFPGILDFTATDFEQRYLPRHDEHFAARGGADQLDAACDRLRDAPDTQSASMVLLRPDEPAEEGAPDLLSTTFNIVDGELFATFVLRRCDLYTDWPLEATALVRRQRDAADRLGLGVGSTTFVIHSAALRDGDVDRSTRVLKEFFMRPLPLHVDPSGVFLFGNDAEGARAMLLNHDASEIFWEDAFSDPEDLSWYIVDVMPWLLPQHIRYVGQECAALMRAMQVGECYLQG